jgi:hypothetical protein
MSSPPWRSRAQVAGEHTEREDVAAERSGGGDP